MTRQQLIDLRVERIHAELKYLRAAVGRIDETLPFLGEAFSDDDAKSIRDAVGVLPQAALNMVKSAEAVLALTRLTD